MNSLLHHVDRITDGRDRVVSEQRLTEALHCLLEAEHTRLYKQLSTGDEPLVGLAVECHGDATAVFDDGVSWPPDTTSIRSHRLLEQCRRTGESQSEHCGDTWHRVVPVAGSDRDVPLGFVSLRRTRPIDGDELALAQGLVRVFGNHQALIEYSESDALTGLLNRKTFDEFLYRILAAMQLHDDAALDLQETPVRRHPVGEDRSHWLAVMDIDHFKRINDNFGHLMGDEVLVMTANRLRSSFRTLDKCFRFGGEEFVVVLKPATAANALRVMERFRSAMMDKPFPQVGTVTISIGLTRIGEGDSADSVLENADRALYWAKENGRNRVASYETLVASGYLEPKAVRGSDVDLF